MGENDFPEKLEKAKNIPDIFELVKEGVYLTTKEQRSGLMLGMADLGEGKLAWIGGYHIIASNAIIMNTRPIRHIEEHNPDLYKPYIFSILLHEYLHTLGLISELKCRQKTYEIAEKLFGNHLVTEMAKDISKFLPYIRNAKYGWMPPLDPSIQFVKGFDRSSATYFI